MPARPRGRNPRRRGPTPPLYSWRDSVVRRPRSAPGLPHTRHRVTQGTQSREACQVSSSYSGPKASNTLPGLLPNAPYPELTYTIPPATTAPGPIIESRLAGTPLTVWKSRLLSNSHNTSPVAVEYARNEPSLDPENTAPAIAVTA